MQEEYSKFRECLEKLDEYKKQVEKLKFEQQSLHDKIYRLETEKSSLTEKVESLSNYLKDVESVSNNKNQIINSLTLEVKTYRKLIVALILAVLVLMVIIVYQSVS